MLLDIQNRGQLSAGMTSYNPDRQQLLETYRGLGSVSEVFNVGRYIDEWVRDAGILKLRSRLCVYDSELILNSLIYPI